MQKHEILKEEFSKYLDSLTKEINVRSDELKKDGCVDEAKLEKIKANVVDIFSKMFVISYNNIFINLSNPNVRKAVEGVSDDYEKLKYAFIMFLDMIPAPWIETKQMAIKHNDTLKIVIEEIKLHTVNEIREKFMTLYELNN